MVADQPEEGKQRGQERWRNGREWATLVFVVATTIGIFIQACIFHSSDLAFQRQAASAIRAEEFSARAWLVPTGASFFDKPVTEQSRIKVHLTNSGKVAAANVEQIDAMPITRRYPRVGEANVPYIDDKDWPNDALCESKERGSVPIGSVYPSQETYYIRHGARGNITDLLKGGHYIIVRGCFLYQDSFARRKSPYCFYSVPPNDSRVPVEDWTFAPCLGTQENPS